MKAYTLLNSFAQSESKSRWLRRKIINRVVRKEIRREWEEFAKRLPTEALINHAFDERHGTDTAEEIRLEETGVSAEDASHGQTIYRPVWESEFHSALATLKIPFEGFTFIDVGSGKGKVLMMAAEYPFSQVVGIEYSPGLHDIAQRNLAKFRSPTQRCLTIEAVLGNALEWDLPKGPVVCLVFNALDPETMRAFVRRIEGDLSSRAEPAYLLYCNLRHVEEIGHGLDGIFKLTRLVKTRRLVVFANRAAGKSHELGSTH